MGAFEAGVCAEEAANPNFNLEDGGSTKPVNLGYVQKNSRSQTGTVGWHTLKDGDLRSVMMLASISADWPATLMAGFIIKL